MTLKLFYNSLMRKRAEAIVQSVWNLYPPGTNAAQREDYTQRRYGLSFDYLKRLARGDRTRSSPSARVLRNMGLQLIVRNPRTGEEEEVEYDLKCDWNPRRPTDLTSTPSPTSSSE